MILARIYAIPYEFLLGYMWLFEGTDKDSEKKFYELIPKWWKNKKIQSSVKTYPFSRQMNSQHI